MLQSEEPLIHYLYSAQQKFMSKLSTKFIKPEVIVELKTRMESFSNVDISTGNQLGDADIGILTTSLIEVLLEDDSW